MRKDKQLALEALYANQQPSAPALCPLCARPLDPDNISDHHLVPKTFGGTELIGLHPICHNKIHSVFSERELLQHYHTMPRILMHEAIQTFVQWIQNKPIDFYEKTKDSAERKGKRRR